MWKLTVSSPIGELTVLLRGEAIRAVNFEREGSERERGHADELGSPEDPTGSIAETVRKAFAAYFAGEIDALDALAVETHGTPFQEKVWAALQEIPAGETRSYSEIADAIGHPTAVRAVGLANGQNPVALVIPCHRVIGKTGTLTGYAGGLERKSWLLRHEAEQTSLPLEARG